MITKLPYTLFVIIVLFTLVRCVTDGLAADAAPSSENDEQTVLSLEQDGRTLMWLTMRLPG